MRSLTLKLSLAFWLVSIIGIVLVAVFAGRSVGVQAEQFESRQAQTFLLNQLQSYYEENERWPRRDNPPRDIGRNLNFDWAVIGVNNNRPVFASRSNLPPARQNLVGTATPIEVGGRVVGRLVIYSSDVEGAVAREVTEARQDFLANVRRGLFFVAISVTAIALLIGIGFARSLVRPIKALTVASHNLAQGNLEQKVLVQSQDEIGELAAAFNKMSQDLATSQQLRQQMTADIAHDLRTPLSVIRGHAEGLIDGILPPDQETFSIIHDEALRLNRLIEDLRTLSLAEAGELPLMIRPIAPADIIERTLLAHKPLADDKGIALESEVASNLPTIAVDADRIAQVLDNLVSNALRYTSAGGRVLLKVQKAGDKLWMTVDDNGKGISADALPHIFERFYRGDASRQRDGSSSGLGLAISRSIIQQHGGDITVRSGNGTQFTITLPIAHRS